MADPLQTPTVGAPLGATKDWWANENTTPGPVAHPEYNPSPAEHATLAEIGARESGGDYNLLHGPGGQHVHDLTQFPQWEGFQGPEGHSHAAGKYGFEPATYADMAQLTGYHDFSPASQDMNALQLLRMRGANSEGSWAASGPYPEPNGGRPVPTPPPSAPRPSGPQQQGPFQSRFDAYEAAPANRADYYLLQQNGAYQWVPKSSVPPSGDNPYYNPQAAQKILNDAVVNSPNSAKHSIGTGLVDLARGFNSQIANLLDLPPVLTDMGLSALSAGMGWQPPTFKFGHPVANLFNKLGLETEKQGEGWASTIGYGVGSGLGATIMALIPGARAARSVELAGEAVPSPASLVTRATGINPVKPVSSAVNELAIGGGSGVAQQEVHELYKGQTGREGDLGDVVSQLAGGGVYNTLRTGLISAAETAVAKGWQGAKAAKAQAAAQTAMGASPAGPNSPEVQQFRAARGYDPNMPNEATIMPLDPQTGRQVADAVLSRQLQDKLDVARDHVEALGTASPENSAAVQAEHSGAAKQAVSSFLSASRAEEAQMWSPEAGVNLDMPRDFADTKNLLQQMKADHFAEDRIRDPASWPVQAEKLLGQLDPQDSLGRGQDVRSRVGQMIEDESAAQGRAPDAAKIGYLKKLRNSLADDMSAGGEGVNPDEIDAYRRAMATSAARATLVESPEMQQFLQAGDAQALDKFLKTGPAGADAVKVLAGAAQAKYGATGLLGAAADALRQKYSDAVAPHGYVSMNDHNRFMQQYGAILDNPRFADVRQQFETAANSEQALNNQIGFGKPGGFGKSGSQLDVRQARAETYLQAPANTVLNHLEGVSNQFTAARAALEQTKADPTGGAALGLQHMVADRALNQPGWAANNPGIIEAMERENPGYAQRLSNLTTGGSLAAIAKRMVDFGAAYVGAQFGGKMAEHMGSSMVMAGRGSSMVRDLAKNGMQKLSGISSALVVDPRAADAWGRTIRGMTPGQVAENSAQRAADMLLFHAYVPGFIFGNLPSGQTSGTGQMGSPPNAAGPPSMQGPGGQPWYKSLPSYAPGAGRS